MYAQVNKKNKKHPSKPVNTQKQRPVSYTEVEIVTDKQEYVISVNYIYNKIDHSFLKKNELQYVMLHVKMILYSRVVICCNLYSF